jgi:hypothetical protein
MMKRKIMEKPMKRRKKSKKKRKKMRMIKLAKDLMKILT